ncbi:hypothetical protein B4907_16835 [Yersinia kristensenii]|nr:hypothetical protein B4907_16835 [Yersinia kristensenii]
MDISIKFPQGKDFDRLLAEMDKKVGVQLLREAGREALAIVQADMIQHAGYDEKSDGPHMRDNIKISSTQQTANGRYATIISLRVGPSKEHYMKALAQEFGTVKQVGAPFIRPALDYNKAKVLQILAARIRVGLEQK